MTMDKSHNIALQDDTIYTRFKKLQSQVLYISWKHEFIENAFKTLKTSLGVTNFNSREWLNLGGEGKRQGEGIENT